MARLVVIGVIAFALGEPILLAGPPEMGQRALAAVIVFILAAGVVLAAASSAGTFRHTLQAGGKASLSMVPVKIVLAILLLAGVLAVGLGVPGLNYEGSGRLEIKVEPGGAGSGRKSESSSKSEGKSSQGEKGKQGERKQGQSGKGERSGRQSSGRGSSAKSPAQWIFSLFAGLGKLLMIPLILFTVGFMLYMLVKLWPVLKGLRGGIGERFRRWLEKLRAMMRRRKRADSVREEMVDPLVLMAGIPGLEPREAIIAAYGCFVVFLQGLGYKRIERLTPYEYLSGMPEQFDYLDKPAHSLTELYVLTAYGVGEPTQRDGQDAVDSLFRISRLIEEKKVKSND